MEKLVEPAKNQTAVRCRGVTKTYGEGNAAVQALRGVDLEVRLGELLMLVGPSGCGKTTLISVLAGLLQRDGGDCSVLDHDYQQTSVNETTRFRGQNIGFVFQAFNLIPALTAAENVATPLLINGEKRRAAMEQAGAVLQKVGFDERMIRSLLAELDIRRATVQVAEAQLADAQYELELAKSLSADRITSVEDRNRKRFAVQVAEAQLAQTRADVKASQTDLERLTVHAPVDGQVLQLKVHLGEFAPLAATAAGEPPLILLGSVTPLHVRVDVDENDAWRVRAGAPAIGCLRGNKNIKTPLTFVRFEPYVVPKKSLTGDSAERVDTRVLQVVFSFERADLPIYVGQQMDVFIDTPEPTQNGGATTTTGGR